VERFAAALKESERADEAARERDRATKAEAVRKGDEATAHASALANSRRDLERAVEAVRSAKQSGRGRAEADAAWKVAKARVIEMETGVAPSWAPKAPPEPDAPESDAADERDDFTEDADATD
jgi:hypothetical protein